MEVRSDRTPDGRAVALLSPAARLPADRHDASAWLRLGAGFTETAKASWSAGLTGRYWITDGIALGLEAWALEAPRPSPYRMQQAMAFIQQLW